MIEDGIHDGDLIIVKSQETADNGQTVVALVDGEATVKRFYRRDDAVELRPANAAMAPIVAAAGRVRVRGVVIGLVRQYK
jgi:repressor LexA